MTSLADDLRTQYLDFLGYTPAQAAKKTNRDLEIEYLAAGAGDPLTGLNADLILDWTESDPAGFVNGFSTQAGNPLAYAVVELAGARYLIQRGSVVLPNPLPVATTVVHASAYSLSSGIAFAHYFYEHLGTAGPPVTGWNTVGKRTMFSLSGKSLNWQPGGTAVAAEVVDMSALGAVRVV